MWRHSFWGVAHACNCEYLTCLSMAMMVDSWDDVGTMATIMALGWPFTVVVDRIYWIEVCLSFWSSNRLTAYCDPCCCCPHELSYSIILRFTPLNCLWSLFPPWTSSHLCFVIVCIEYVIFKLSITLYSCFKYRNDRHLCFELIATVGQNSLPL